MQGPFLVCVCVCACGVYRSFSFKVNVLGRAVSKGSFVSCLEVKGFSGLGVVVGCSAVRTRAS